MILERDGLPYCDEEEETDEDEPWNDEIYDNWKDMKLEEENGLW